MATRVRAAPTAVGWMCVTPCGTPFSIAWSVSSVWYPIAAEVAGSASIVLPGRKANRLNKQIELHQADRR